MTDDIFKSEVQFIESVAEDLNIDLHSVRHIIFENGSEIIGEMLPLTYVLDDNGNLTEIHKDDAEYNDSRVFGNPVKVMTDSFMGDSGVNTAMYLTRFNVCSDEPFTSFKRHSIANICKPNHDTLFSYMQTLHQLYNPAIYKFENLDDISDEQLEAVFTNEIEMSRDESGNNVIQFEPYLLRKQYE